MGDRDHQRGAIVRPQADNERTRCAHRNKRSKPKPPAAGGNEQACRQAAVIPAGHPPAAFVRRATTPCKPVDKPLGEQSKAAGLCANCCSQTSRAVCISAEPDDGVVAIVESRTMRHRMGRTKRLDQQARRRPQGSGFAEPLQEAELAALLRRTPKVTPFLVAVDGVTDPGNLGALLRCCDGAGVHGVVLPRHRAVHVTPTVAKSAAGAIEHVPMAVVGGLPAALARMKEAGIWVVGLDDDAERSLFDLGDLAADAICLVLGAEGAGLSRLVRERCDLIVSIPMRGRLSSLNVSAAAGIAVYEVARYRSR